MQELGGEFCSMVERDTVNWVPTFMNVFNSLIIFFTYLADTIEISNFLALI